MVPSLPLLSCEALVSVKENPDRNKKGINFLGQNVFLRILGYFLMLEIPASSKDPVFEITFNVSKKP